MIVLVGSPEFRLFAGLWPHWDAGFYAPELILRMVGGFIGGGYLGRMAGYGQLGSLLARRGYQLTVIPDHPDGAGGLKPIGTYYLRQSLTASLPAIFLAGWIVLLSLSAWYPPVAALSWYRPQYLWLLAVAIVFEMLAFLLPMRSIHRMMTTQKDTALSRRADQMSRLIVAQRQQAATPTGNPRTDSSQELPELLARYHALDHPPTWPFDRSIRQRFTLRNLLLVLPLVGHAVTDPWIVARTHVRTRAKPHGRFRSTMQDCCLSRHIHFVLLPTFDLRGRTLRSLTSRDCR